MLRKIEFKIGYLEKAGLFPESSSGRSVFLGPLYGYM